MVKKSDVPRIAVDTALELAGQQGWRDTTMADIAAAGGMTLTQLHEAYAGKGAILDAFVERVDAKVLAAGGGDIADEPAKDRLFDVMMRRYDALDPYRDGLRSIARASACSPAALIFGGCRLERSMAWMLEAAGISTAGPLGRLRVKGLAAIHAAVMRVFLDDDSEDLAATMAALDRRLDQADRLASMMPGSRRRHGGEEPAGQPA